MDPLPELGTQLTGRLVASSSRHVAHNRDGILVSVTTHMCTTTVVYSHNGCITFYIELVYAFNMLRMRISCRIAGQRSIIHTRSTSMKGKKRSAKSTDFPRKKRKLGKGKRPAENATNISFKSRSIVVHSQLEQSQQPTGKRKLTFEVCDR